MGKTIIASDNFTRANGPIGSNWSASVGTAWNITSDQADSGTNNPGYVRWVGAGSFANNQYSIVTIGPSAIIAATYFGVVLNDNGTNFYTLVVYGFGDYFLEKNGTALTFAAAPSLAIGDTIELDNVGGVLTGYHNGVQFVTYTDVTPLTGGTPGMAAENAGADAFYSNWVGGNITFSISGNAGVAGATVSYSGTASGSVVADGSGNYTISGLSNGPYTITPSLAGYTFSPTSASETLAGSNITGVNFTATAVVTVYSVVDSRDTGNWPNNFVTVQGTKQYTVQKFDSRKAGAPVDSRAAGAPVDSRKSPNIPENSRTQPPFES